MKRNIFRTTFLLLIMVSFILITTVDATSVIGELKNNINTGSNTDVKIEQLKRISKELKQRLKIEKVPINQ